MNSFDQNLGKWVTPFPTLLTSFMDSPIYAVSSPTCLVRELDGDETLRRVIGLLVS